MICKIRKYFGPKNSGKFKIFYISLLNQAFTTKSWDLAAFSQHLKTHFNIEFQKCRI